MTAESNIAGTRKVDASIRLISRRVPNDAG